MWPGGEGDRAETSDLDAQFAQQHQAMDHMRQMLAERDQQQAARVRQAQAYASRLTEIKSRAKAFKRSASKEAVEAEQRSGDGAEEEKVLEADVSLDFSQEKEEPEKQPGLGRKSDKFRHGNLSLLRKQMEENRVRFEQRGKEMTESKRGVEEMLTQLKKQLDERDQIIQGLRQETVPSVQHAPEPAAAPGEGRQLQELLASREATIAELSARVFELEENVREKDSVIEARTRAIALLSEDLSRRSKTTLDALDETRQQMTLMQHNFVALEAGMKEEKERLNAELEAKDKRLAEAQESVARLEAARYDLSTRNAALQEKVVRLQELGAELRAQQDTEARRAEQLGAALEEANRQAVRAKAGHANKVKALRKQLDALGKVTDVNDEISKLQNRIAELEEEKGNLQLHLVDFDELKVSEASLKQRVAELEERVRQSSQDLDSHVHVISLLEADKLNLLQREQAQTQQISGLVAENAELKTALTSMEMKAVELEEQVDVLLREKAEVTATQSRDEQFEVMELSMGEEAGDRVGKNEKDSSNLEVVLRSLEAELGEARRSLEEQRTIISDLSVKLDSKEEELEMQREMISELERLSAVDNRTREEDGDRITDILKDVGDMAADLEEWKTRCSEVEDRLKALETENVGLEARFRDVRSENGRLGAVLQEHVEGIRVRDSNILKLQAVLEENGQVLKERESALREVQHILNEVQENFKNRCSELEIRLQEKQAELESQKFSISELENILAGKDSELECLKTELNKKQHQLDVQFNENKVVKENLESNFHNKIEELSVQIEQLNSINQQLIQEASDLKNDILEKNKYIEKLELGIKNSEEVEKQLEVTTDSLNKLSDDLASVKHELNSKCLEYSETARKLGESEDKNKEKTEKLKRLTANLKAKALALRGSEDKVKHLEVAIEAKESTLSELNAKLAILMENASRAKDLEVILKDKEEQLIQMKFHCEELEVVMRDKESKILELAEETSELKQVTEKLHPGETHDQDEVTQVQNEMAALKARLDYREKEIEQLRVEQVELLQKCNDAEYKNNHLMSKINKLEQRNNCLEVNKSENKGRVAELEDEMAAKDFDYVEAMGKVEGLQDVISEQKLQYDINVETSVKDRMSYASQQNMNVVGRDMKIVELEEQISSIQERYQQTWAASEAKLQEREAVVESLESDLARSQDRVQSLENMVSEMGEQHGSLRSSLVAQERRLEEVGMRLQEEEERRRLLEVELARLVGTETSSRQNVEELLEKKVELESCVKEMTAERDELRKCIAALETSSRETLNEVERLSEFESAFNEESVRVQALMMQLRQQATEMESKSRDLEESRQYCDSLESDLRICHQQLEELEAERRNLVENEGKLVSKLMKVEDTLTSASDEWEGKLNDQNNQILQLQREKEKLCDSLGNKMESLQHVTDVKVENYDDFQKQIAELNIQLCSLKEVIVKKEEEIKTYQTRLLQLQFGGQGHLLAKNEEISVQNKISELETVNAELHRTIEQYDKNIFDLQEQLSHARIDLEGAYLKLNHYVEETNLLNEKTNVLQGELAAKNTELLELSDKYQWELNAKPFQLEELSNRYQGELNAKHFQLEELSNRYQGELNAKTHEFQELSNKYKEDMNAKNIELQELNAKNFELQDLNAKKVELQEIRAKEITDDTTSLSAHADCEYKIAVLKQEKDELLRQLLWEKASAEVQNIITLAEEHVRSAVSPTVDSFMPEDQNVLDENVTVKNVDDVASQSSTHPSVCFEAHSSFFQPSMKRDDLSSAAMEDLLWYNTRIQELEDQVLQLQRNLNLVESERNDVVVRVKELEALSREPEKQEPDVELVPVVEEVCVQKSAYLTYQPDEPALHPSDSDNEPRELHNITFFQEQLNSPFSMEVEPVALEDESWGWGTDEARLEEEHLKQKQVSSPSLETLERQLEALVAEKKAAEEEVKAMQIRCDKLLHKLKDSKIKNDNLMKENLELTKRNMSASGFGDLDSAIEEEFKIRVNTLEKNINDLTAELDTARLERESLLKQIDILTSANSKILEIKEKQDLDLDFCQKRFKELTNAKEAVEWMFEELTEENKLLLSKIGELECELNVLRAEKSTSGTQLAALSEDNEQLQILLEEQRSLRLKAEADLSRKVDQFSLSAIESAKEAVIKNTVSTMDDLGLEKESRVQQNENLSHALVSLQSEYPGLKASQTVSDNSSMGDFSETKICNKCDSLQKQYEDEIDSLTKEMSELRRQYDFRMEENSVLLRLLKTAQSHFEKVYNKCERMADKWLHECVNIEEEKSVILQLRDELEASVRQLTDGVQKAVSGEEGSFVALFANKDSENYVSQLREQEKMAAEIEALTESVSLKNEEIRRLQDSIASRDEKVQQLEEHARSLSSRPGDVQVRGESGGKSEDRQKGREDEDTRSLSQERSEARELRRQLEAREEEVSELRRQLAAREEDVQELRALRGDPGGGEQSELDLALYMLHQRDVRCDELTLELMQLLEERDTLQLRLSNALRTNEQLRSQAKSSADSTTESLNSARDFVGRQQEVGEPAAEENRESLQALDSKLSQLHSVGYRRDVTFRDEQEHRHSVQTQLLQRTGPGVVVDASYTLSRDVQPQSTVLLNWIRGRSTPRVMHV
ncbi:protein lava lamp-like isoform X2 [Bacillus rossius redtenbacheri]|uniref:protein lava lamp-like isoform X2 n=1 Tax=Bacillus rossius redtenbacheri TaxID=93214 RepID=UPI002FDD7EA5